MRTTLRVFVTLLAAILAGATLFWFWLAIGVHLDGAVALAARTAVVAAAAVAVLALLRLRWRRLLALTLSGIVAAQVWWAFVPAQGNLDWAPELAHGITASMDDDGIVTLQNVRNFSWTTRTDYVPSWETRVVDPDRITSVDVFTSVWDSPLIAHTMISFGFDDGRHVVFSSEIRRTREQVFSTLGGFVREFELILVGADERDVIHLRTDVRRESVSLYPLTLSPAARKALFLGFVDFGNDLAAQPRWYNTLTENCTTVPFRIARGLGGRLPLDWRLIASGRLYEYLHDEGVLAPGMDLAAIAARARLPVFGPLPPDGRAYSRALRAGWDG